MVLSAKGPAKLWLWIWIFCLCSHIGIVMLDPMMPTPAPIPQFTSHSGQVCSTWGNYHFKSFNGDIYSFPGTCNYLFASHCKSNNEDFNIQIRRSVEHGNPVITHITAILDGVVVEIKNKAIMLDGLLVTELPTEKSRVRIDKLGDNIKITVSNDISLICNKDDSLLLKLNRDKYANQTCGLCGDFSGVRGFTLDGKQLTPVEYGNMQKRNGPTEECLDVIASAPNDCRDKGDICKSTLTSAAFFDCNTRVDPMEYIDACEQDLCHCSAEDSMLCLCRMFAEYSRQCTHSGGVPGNWRTPELCPQSCPLYGMEYQESGSPCPNTCSNTERTMLCEDHGIEGCFCPSGTVLDDINNAGCIRQEECSCVYNSEIFTPGSSFNAPCRECTCSRGKWKCKELPCTGSCSVESGSHITSFDGSRYSINGDCSYVLAKHTAANDFTVLVELRRSEITSTKSSLKSVVLGLNKGETVLVIKDNGVLSLNWMPIQVPICVANMTIFWSTSFYINIHTTFDAVIQVQLTPTMQVYITLGPSYHDQTSGLCGNFNNIQSDDFKAISGVAEGTAASFANTWKSNSNCPNIKNSYEDPCSQNLEKEKYAQHWCALLTSPTGPFSLCHSVENPHIYYTHCLSDTCSCKDSEECMCAALASYAYACAKKGVTLSGWRDSVCEKYTKSCKESQVYQYNVTRCQPTCRSRSNDDAMFDFEFSPVDGCVCREGMYLNDNGDCVTSTSCPCYYQGNVIESGEKVEENGITCTCDRGHLNCMGAVITPPVCSHPLVYLNCSSAPKGTKGVECQKSCHSLDMDCFSSHCTSGCVCPPGLVSDGSGGCISEQQCPCIHNEATYRPGDSISVSCNTCVCKNRRWQCTHKPCLGTCSVYGDGHYISFDNRQFTFSGSCEYILAQDSCGENRGQSSFRVVTENVPCGTTGTTCSKNIKFLIGGEELRLGNEKIDVVKRDEKNTIPYHMIHRGMYLIIKSENGVILMWDTKSTIYMKLASHFQGKVCGLCGNYDGNANNDFTTRSQSVVENLMEFGNSWKTSPTCPNTDVVKDPCSINPYRKPWALRQCNIITSDVFRSCHAQVDPSTYYESCISDSCACDTGGDCECFCTIVALYAQACSENGICVNWRTPTICPMFCDYYNDVGECEWHYKACGDKCMKTCRNPKGECLHELSGCEGCYPKCPPSRPFLNEDTMKCVAECGCVENGIFYNYGDKVPRSCYSCVCAMDKIRCYYDITACQCIYEDKLYNYGDTIPNSNKEDSKCHHMKCDANGEIVKINNCPLEPTSLPLHNTTKYYKQTTHLTKHSTPTSKTTPSNYSLSTRTPHECYWTEWVDVNHPTSENAGGDEETFEIAKTKGIHICKAKEFIKDIKCRSSSHPDIAIEMLPQKVTCNTETGLLCKNQDNPEHNYMCYNYEVKFYCCDKVIPSPTTATSPPTTHMSTSSRHSPPKTVTTIRTVSNPTLSTNAYSTTSTQGTTSNYPTTTKSPSTPRSTCYWTEWFDVNHPTSDNTGGDEETFEIAENNGIHVCKAKEFITDIKCRSSSHPDIAIEMLSQKVTCNTETGLICKNQDNPEHNYMCYNYEAKFFCCDKEIPSLTTATSPPTSHMSTSSRHSQSTPKTVTTSTTFNNPTQSTAIFPTTSTKVTLSTLSNFPTTLLRTSSSPVVCYWTEWVDENHPKSDINGGDEETFDIAKSKGRQICKAKKFIKDIKCRSSSYPDIAIEMLSQKVTCNTEIGLICKNQDNPEQNYMCYNYEVKFYCCDEEFPSTTTVTSSPTSHMSTSSQRNLTTPKKVATLTTVSNPTSSTATFSTTSTQGTTSNLPTTTKTQSTRTPPSECYWTEWVDVNHPTSDNTGGDEETFEIAENNGIHVCKAKEFMKDIKCRSSSHPDIAIEMLSQKVTCNTETGLICKNQDNPEQNYMCYNYEVKFYCCDEFPSSTTATSSPTNHMSKSSQHNLTTPKRVTTLTTVSNPTSSTATFSTTSTQGTTSNLPTTTKTQSTSTPASECYWTEWVDENHPISDINGGDEETFDIAKSKGRQICKAKKFIKDIKCRSSSYPDIAIEMLSQKVTCNTEIGLICKNQDNPEQNYMCYNYEVKFYCCDEEFPSTTTVTSSPTNHMSKSSQRNLTTPKKVTTLTTVSNPTATFSTTSTQGTTSNLPTTPKTQSTSTPASGCYWTEWVDVNHPTSENAGGDEETFEIAKTKGIHICKAKEFIKDIKCRSSSHPDIAIEMLPQKVTCNTETGLLCKNQDNPEHNYMCYNYEVKFYCCDKVIPSPTTATSPPTTHMSTSSRHSPPKTVTTIRTVSNPTLSTNAYSTTSTQGTTSNYPTTTKSPSTPRSICYWTEWVDINHPTSDNTGGDEETFEIAQNNGIHVCKAKEFIKDIKCRSSSHPDIAIEMLSQKVTCNTETGLICKNQDNPEHNYMCYNYEAKFFCCDKEIPSLTTATSPPTSHMSTSSGHSQSTPKTVTTSTTFNNPTLSTAIFPTTSTKVTLSTLSNFPTTLLRTSSSPVACYWTEWVDENHPKSDINGGDEETFDIAKSKGRQICKAKKFIKDIKCRSSSYPDIAIEMLSQKVTCNTEIGLICKNQDNPEQNYMCYNYEVKFYCCDEEFPSTTTVTSSPTSHMSKSSQRNLTTPKKVATLTTVSNPTSSTATFSTTSTQGTTSNLPTTTKTQSTRTPPSECYWTEWVDVNHPTSDNTGGDEETFEIAENNGIHVCKAKEFMKDIKCRSSSHPDIAIEMLSQKVTCNTETGLICKNQDNPEQNYMCYNYEVKFYCCDEFPSSTTATSSPTNHMSKSSQHNLTTPKRVTTLTTVSNPTSSTATFSTTSTQGTTSNLPTTTKTQSTSTPASECYWTEWVDENHPRSDINGGDEETFDIAKSKGRQICKAKKFIKDIKCRSSSYPDIAIEMLSQKVTCNTEIGLICKNQDNPEQNYMCYNYEVKFYCCDEEFPSTTTVTSSPTNHMSKSSQRNLTTPKKVTTLTTVSNPTATFSTTSTQGTTSNLPTTTKTQSTSTPASGCYWTEWVDVNHPTSENAGGDEETFEIAKTKGIHICKAKEFIKDIKCRSSSHPDIAIEMLPQKVTCNTETGLICKNQDNPEQNYMCYNYEVKFYCCDEFPSSTTATSSPTNHMSKSSQHNLTTPKRVTTLTTVSNPTSSTATFSTTSTQGTTSNLPTTTKTQSTSTPASECYWTEWVDENHPRSDINGGDEETFDIAKSKGRQICKAKKFIKDIKCRSSSYPDIAIEMLSQKVTCNTEIGLICKNQDNPEQNYMCYNYEVKFYCCDEEFPSTTTVTSSPTNHMSKSSQRNLTTPKKVTTLTTVSNPTATFSTTFTQGTTSNLPTTTKTQSTSTPASGCYWTEWVDVNHPTSENAGGDEETFEIAKTKGIHICKAKEFIKDIKCRSSSHPDIAIEMLPQKVTCNTETGLLCKNQDNPEHNYMCYNYEVKFYCCDKVIPSPTTATLPPTTHMSTSSRHSPPKTVTTIRTVSNPTLSTNAYSTTSTQGTTSNYPTTTKSPSTPRSICYWTEWVDVNHPTSDNTGGDEETFEIAQNNGIHVCKAKEFIKDIKCRSSSHPDIAIEMLSQKVTCNTETGLICKNQDNPEHNYMCYNYEAKFFCCDKEIPSLTTATSPPTSHMSTSSRHRQSTPKTVTISTTFNNPTLSTAIFPTTSTKVTLSTLSNFPTTLLRTSSSPVACYWTEWVDENHPKSDINGGDEETFDIAKSKGRQICKAKKFIKDIKCRSSSYPDIAIEMLSQKVTCNTEIGLICKNQDNPEQNYMCYNYEVKFYCCDEEFPSTTTVTSSPTSHMSKSSQRNLTTPKKVATLTTVSNPTSSTATFSTTSTQGTTSNLPTTTKTQSTRTPPSECYWTEWVDVNHPTSDNTGGDEETFEIAENNGIHVCKAKEFMKDIKCRSSSHPDIAIEMLSQKVTCNTETGLICKNQDNPEQNYMCYNYEVKFYCCDEFPSSTTATSSPTNHMSKSSQHNLTTPKRVTTLTTVSNPTSSTATFSTTSTQRTTSNLPTTTKTQSTSTPASECYWTEWVDENHPRSDINGGDEETFDIAKSKGRQICKAKKFIKDIKCRSSSYPDIAIEMLSQKVTCNTEIGLICKNQDNPEQNYMCYNYEVKFYCCDEEFPSTTTVTSSPTNHMSKSSQRNLTTPKKVTTLTTVSNPTATFSTTSTQGTTSNLPTTPKTQSTSTPASGCYWTEWVDVNHPTSDNTGGDEETFEIAENNGIHVCKAKEFMKDIKCRSSSHPDIAIEMLSQKVTCNTETGLICKNQDNPEQNYMCYNYEVKFFCCDKEILSLTTTTSPPTLHMSTSSRHSQSTPKTVTTSTTFNNPTLSTAIFPTTSTKVTLSTLSNFPTTWLRTSSSPVVCYWTEWVDENHPRSDINGGDEETFDIAKSKGRQVCKDKKFIKDIKCRSSSHPDIAIEMLSQKVTCNTETGLICKNQDNPEHNYMCYNYEAKFFCCDKEIPSLTTATSPPTSHMSTSSRHSQSTPKTVTISTTFNNPTLSTAIFPTTSTKVTLSTLSNFPTTLLRTSSSPVACYWTEWVDENHPKSDINGGDEETFDIAKSKGRQICKAKKFIKDIKCRSSSYPDIAIEMLSQKVTCNTEIGLICKNQDNPEQNYMCYNYEVKFYCCDEEFPSTTTVTSSPTSHMSKSSQRNLTTPKKVATLTTVSNPTSSTATFSTTSTQGTTSNLPTTTKTQSTRTPPSECYWTEWVDVNHPTSDNTGGDEETFEIAENNGIHVCKAKEFMKDIKCRSSSHPDIAIEMLSQKVTCNTETGLICKNQDNPEQNYMCYNYEVKFYCCDEFPSSTTATSSPTNHMSKSSQHNLTTPKRVTTLTTVSNPTSSTATFSTTSTQRTTSNLPTTTKTQSTSTPASECYWTEWVDENHPRSDINGGDEETFDIAKSKGRQICKAKKFIKDIKCRSSSYPDIAIEMLSQKVTCNTETGLICKNQDNPEQNYMCYNYEVKFFCCDKEILSLTTTTSPPTLHMSTSSRHSQSTPKTVTTSTTSNNPTLSTAIFPTTSTKVTLSTLSNFPTTWLRTSSSPVVCYWTEWVDENHPRSDINGGDEETFDIAKSKGRQVCKDKKFIKDIKCRSSSYPDIAIEMLPQKVTCSIETGLLCRNRDNPGARNMCFNYEVKFYCCDDISRNTPTLSSFTHLSTSSRYVTPHSTIETIETTSSRSSPSRSQTSTTPFTEILIVCNYEGSKYEVGSSVPNNPENCEECKCTMENSASKVICRPKVCQTHCPVGFIYKQELGQCCGNCVQASCLLDVSEIMKGQSDNNLPEQCCHNCSQDVCTMNNTVVIKPEKFWRPPGDNCTSYDCEPNKFSVIRRVMSCPVQTPLKCDQGIQVNFTSADGCCTIQYCEPRKCDVMKSWKLIESEGCEANVTLTNCGGYCTSMSRHPSFPKMVEHDCTCCQPTLTAPKKIHLLCANGRKISYSYTDVLQCACRGAACVFTE
ncbi:mucin-5AC-like [Ranitomeya imitator]|uniref:mucin-5AC-like n=1 Tax=Ranitomeya imitator TaxID=111125 RepID=UPI0037E9619B